MFLSKWDAVLVPVLCAFYYNIKHTIKVKAFTCFTVSFFSILTTLIDYDRLLDNPQNSGYLTDFTSSLIRNYVFIDTINLLYNAHNKVEKLRKDVIIHHILVGISSIFTHDTLGLCYGIITEIYSCGALFNLHGKLDLLYRACTIIFVRMRIWVYYTTFIYMEMKYHLKTTAFWFGILMVALDCVWLFKIVKRMRTPRKRATSMCDNCKNVINITLQKNITDKLEKEQ
jgi:hypothetical protein